MVKETQHKKGMGILCYRHIVCTVYYKLYYTVITTCVGPWTIGCYVVGI